jgi:pyruvate kinase
MVSASQPERSELSEISLATIDGADCFILSCETSMGKSPVDSTIYMSKAIAEAEGIYDYE